VRGLWRTLLIILLTALVLALLVAILASR